MNEVIQFSVVQDSAGSTVPAQDAAILEFELIELTERYLRIQINFAKPEAISQNILAPDLLEIELKLGDIFIDSEDFQRLEKNLILDLPLPKQMSLDDYETIEAIGETAEKNTQTFSLVTFIVCLCLGYGLKYIWNIINILQFTIFMLRWQILLPLLTE